MTIRNTLPVGPTVAMPVAASVAHARGDLAYYDSVANVAKSADVQADQGSEPKNQRLFASLFCGVFQDTRLTTQTTAGESVLVEDGIFDCTCASATFKKDQLIGPLESAGGTALEPQKVVAVTDPSLAIGYVTEDQPNATTTVRARLISNFAKASKPAAPGYEAGAGGAVTQITSITTGVTLSKPTGQITTVVSTLAAGVDASFTVTNTCVEAGDTIVINTKSYAGTADGIPICKIQSVADGSFIVNVHNQGAVALDALIVMSFAIIKAKAA